MNASPQLIYSLITANNAQLRRLGYYIYDKQTIPSALLIPGEFCVGVDLWEGNGDINEQAFLAGGVKFTYIRLNSISGGHHLDSNFQNQWNAAYGLFYRWPYFVYNPWADGRTNFEWLADNMPAEAVRICADIEVRKDGYTPAVYANEVDIFQRLVRQYWRLTIYTGAWFIPMLSYWPSDIDYTWARYPLALYPPTTENITWEQLQAKLVAINWAPGVAPGPVKVWQCSGDRYKLPGSNSRVVDINLFNGPEPLLADWAGEESPMQKSWAISMTSWARTVNPPYTGPEPYALGY